MAVTSVQFAVATHIMTAMGFHYGTEVNSSSLADSVNADATFVRKSLSKLVKAGLVTATRGKNGSCTLARSPKEITLRDIYLACEAPTAIAMHSYPVEETCPISSNIKGYMSDIQEGVQRSLEETLAKTTLAEVVAGIRARVDQSLCPTLNPNSD